MNFHQPLVMGVLNVTPDSFSDGGDFVRLEAALDHARVLQIAGADIIDVGGESTRPGANRVTLAEEQARVLPVIEAIVGQLGAKVSIDTMNAETARLAVAAGASIINDVSGGLADTEMFGVAADTGATIIISHWRGFSDQMDTLASYDDVAAEVAAELKLRVDAALAAGIRKEQIVIDPGLGFAKDMQQNWKLVARLDKLEQLGYPILVGASRKRFIAGVIEPDEPAEVSNERRDLATAVLTALLLQRKIWGVRVHNVLATTDAIRVVAALRDAEQS
ncbi:MAG: dihydropteroate synthase [Micrococcales bacterium]